MGLYNFDVYKAGQNLTNPRRRKPRYLGLLYSICAGPLQYILDKHFTDYKTGAAYSNYNGATAYVKYDKVIYVDDRVYELVADTATGVAPTDDTTTWQLYQEDFLGFDDRLAGTGQMYSLSYLLNKKFRAGASKIWIENDRYVDVMGGGTTYGYKIHVPSSLWTGIAPSDPERVARVRNFAVKYNIAGVVPWVDTY